MQLTRLDFELFTIYYSDPQPITPPTHLHNIDYIIIIIIVIRPIHSSASEQFSSYACVESDKYFYYEEYFPIF